MSTNPVAGKFDWPELEAKFADLTDKILRLTEPSSIPYRTHPAYAKRAAYPDPPPVIPLPESIAAQVTPSPGRGLLATRNQDRDD